jgi:hypothetical protein
LARDFIAEEERCLARTQHREQMTTGRIAATAAVIAAVCALATLIATLLR